ncbi:MAG: phage tail protein [Rhodospirillaceae bacterium]|nr:phage tail protein [Rhodospirillaceae bacterium]
MPRFANATKSDPYRNFNFRIFMGGVEVAACRKISALDATVNTVKFRAGNSTHTVDEQLPGRVEFAPFTAEAGLTNDTAFQDFANLLVAHEGRPTRAPDPEFRRDIEIYVHDIDNTPAIKFTLHRAWVSKFTTMSELAGDGNDVLFESLEFTHEGFTRENQS